MRLFRCLRELGGDLTCPCSDDLARGLFLLRIGFLDRARVVDAKCFVLFLLLQLSFVECLLLSLLVLLHLGLEFFRILLLLEFLIMKHFEWISFKDVPSSRQIVC